MSDDKFYKNHWLEIEDERMARYEQMFAYQDWHADLLAPLGLKPGMAVADFGCGPGFLAMELAAQVGPTGQAFGFDINPEFIRRATDRATEAGLEHLAFRQLDDDRLLLQDNSLDRLFCKNVLEYVPDARATLSEHHRVLKPGALIEIVDSDWGFLLVEPWGKQRTEVFFEAAAGAYRDPNIGRKLYGLLRDTGFDEIRVNIQANIDTQGRLLNVITNIASYIRKFQTLPEAEVATWLDDLKRAVDEERFLATLPQFVVTAHKRN